VVTTVAGQRRLRAGSVRGLRPGETTQLSAPGKPTLTVTATPCRHGPPLSRPIAGAVIGFALSLTGSSTTRLWMTGDTVLSRPVQRVAQNLDVDVLPMHLGSVRFPQTGPLRYSMDSGDALRLIDLANPRIAIPVHDEGWSHFREPEQHLRATLARTGAAPQRILKWLTPGEAQAM